LPATALPTLTAPLSAARSRRATLVFDLTGADGFSTRLALPPRTAMRRVNEASP
jgi:hypothetical protein